MATGRNGSNVAVARYNTAGTLDVGFGRVVVPYSIRLLYPGGSL